MKKLILVSASFVAGFFVFYFAGGLSLAIIFSFIWADKVLLSQLKIHGIFGIELLTLPVILAGIIYGPLWGFLFGFFVTTVLTGFLDIISWNLSPPIEIGWPPFVPSLDSGRDGVSAFLAGMLANAVVPFLGIVFVVLIWKNVFDYAKTKLMDPEGGVSITNIFNFVYNMVIALFFHNFFIFVINI